MSMLLAFRLWLASLVVLLGAAVVDQVSGQAKPEARPSRVDAFGDPLPDGAFARLGTVRFRQGNAIYSVAISPDGKTIASADRGAVHFWDAATGKRIHRPWGASWIHSFAFSSNGQALVFWNANTGDQVRKHPTGVVLAVAPDGKTMAFADHGGVIRILDVASGKQLHQPQGLKGEIYALAFSPDGATLAWGGGDGNSAGKDFHLHLADVKTGKELRHWQIEGPHVLSLAFSPDGKTLASAGNGKPIGLWEVATGKELHQLGKGDPYRVAIVFAPDGKTLISAHDSGSIAVWETASGKELHRWPVGGGEISRIALAADGRTLVAGGLTGVVRLWDVHTGKELGPVAGKHAKIEHWAFADDGKTLVSLCLDSTLRHWDAATGQELRRLPGPRGWARTSFAPGGRELVTRESDGVIRIRDTDTGKERWRCPEREDMHYGLDFSPDGAVLVGGLWGTTLRLLDAATGKERCQLVDNEQRRSQSAVFSPDGNLLISSHWQSMSNDGAAGTIKLPSVDCINFWRVSNGKKLHSINGKWEHDLRMSVSRDGRMFALPNPDGSVSLWEMATKKERLRSPPQDTGPRDWFQPPRFLNFSPESKLLFMVEDNNRLLVRETATGKALPPVMVHDGPVRDFGFSPDGKTLAALGKDGTILLWDAARLCRHPSAAAPKVSAKELDSLWADLASEDAARAWKAIETLASAPEPAVALLNERLKPAPAQDVQKIARLVADLGSDNFQQRAKATRELETLGDRAEPKLREALQANPPLEARRRIEAVLAPLEAQILTGDALRAFRAVEALETIGTPEARQVLTRLAKGAPTALLTREAQASLQRLAKRTIAAP